MGTFELVEIIALIILLALSAFFSSSETAFIGLGKLRRAKLAESGKPRAMTVKHLLEYPDRLLVTILIGNNVVNVAAAAIATSLAIEVFGNTGIGIATGVMTFLILIFGEIAPKAYASKNTERLALSFAPIIRFLEWVLYPVVVALSHIMDALFRAFGSDATIQHAIFRSDEDFKALIAVGSEEGIIEEDEREMIHSVIEFGDTIAKEVMVPRMDVVSIEDSSTIKDVLEVATESNFSRIPVYRESMDNIVGILYVKDLLKHLKDGEGNKMVSDIMREAYYVPDTKKLDDLLHELQDRRIHMVIVLDEYGGTAGIVTIEDLLEEIVGEIYDEYDSQAAPVKIVGDNAAIVDARTHIDDVNEELCIGLHEEESFETIGGLVISRLGRTARVGDVVEENGVRIVVEKVARNRILHVRVAWGGDVSEHGPHKG